MNAVAQLTLSRRRLIQTSIITAGGLATALIAPTTAQATTPITSRIVTVPIRWGTPTDLARTNPTNTYTRDPRGTVLRYDKNHHSWTGTTARWSDLIAHGTPVLARWGHPSGTNQLILVYTAAFTATSTPPPASPAPAPPALAATGFEATTLAASGLTTLALGGLIAWKNRRIARLTSDTTDAPLSTHSRTSTKWTRIYKAGVRQNPSSTR